jgi:hypothetical protein
MPKSPMKPSTPKLSDLAKHVVAPKGVTSTGWPAVQAKCADLGIRFRPWQPDVGRLILAKRADGKYAATIGGTGLSIPRQVGKTFLVGAIVFALCLLRPSLTVIWTAHRLRTAEETFGKMQAFAKRKRIAPHIAKVVLGSGDEAIVFRNGSRILFGARERGFGRGFDEVDVLIFDEAQILTESALDDMVPATNQSRQATSALLLFMGTPPKPTDPSEVFTRMRTEALTGEDEDTGWIEFGADDDFEPTPAPADLTEADWAQVAKANPSFPDDTPREAILRMRKQLGPESMLREGYGLWDKLEMRGTVVDLDQWIDLADDGPALDVRPDGMAVDASHDREFSVAACWAVDEFAHAEEVWASGDEAATLRWVAVKAGRRIPVIIDSMSPAASMIPGLKALGVDVHTGSAGDMSKGCGMWLGEVVAGRLTHGNQDSVNTALLGATQRDIGTAGGWGWDRRDPATNIAPLVAHTLARLAATLKRKRIGNGRSTTSGRRAVIL